MAVVKTPQIRAMEFSSDAAELSKAVTILQYAHDSATALLEAFSKVREVRKAGQGRPTDEEQDLLRAMLVIGAAGLDSMLKQVIRDALPTLIRADQAVADGLQKFVERQLRGESDEIEVLQAPRFLAKLLVSESLRDALIEQYILSLTGSSLQSVEELLRACSALGVSQQTAGIKPDVLRPIFTIRNRIIHELDVDFGKQIRNRFPRSRKDMTGNTNALLQVGENVLRGVSTRLPDAS
jgi:hypothetical protein